MQSFAECTLSTAMALATANEAAPIGSAAEVEAKLKQLVSEQRYAPVGKEVTVD